MTERNFGIFWFYVIAGYKYKITFNSTTEWHAFAAYTQTPPKRGDIVEIFINDNIFGNKVEYTFTADRTGIVVFNFKPTLTFLQIEELL